MPRKTAPAAPLTFDLPESVGAKVEILRKRLRVRTTSEAIRAALAEFDFERYVPKRDPHGQISVRIPGELRARLKRTARKNKASVGELIRAAIDAQSVTARRKSAPGRAR